MKYITTVLLLFFLVFGGKVFSDTKKKNTNNKDILEAKIDKIWNESSFKKVLSRKVFTKAMKGYYKYNNFKKNIITIIDYSKPSTEKRLYVINIPNKSIIFHSLVAHGKNTGGNIAKYFSNKPQSKKSSLGFFKTAETYIGKHGYSLKLDGIEKGINDKARKRSIVMHGASYVCQETIDKYGRLGRSWGCPAVPDDLSKQIIDYIAGGSCMFIFADNAEYNSKTRFK